MNDIPVRQNEPLQIERLAAQRQLYSDAKRLQFLAATLAVPFAVLWPLMVKVIPILAPYAALWGISAAVLDTAFLTSSVKETKKRAARIQEEFDCDVLSLRWHDLHSGKRPEPESVRRASKRFAAAGGNREKLKDWYPVSVGKLRLPLARIVCQRASCWWDGDLRRRYSGMVLIVLVLITLVSSTIGIKAGFSFAGFVQAVAAPLLPLFVFCAKQCTENTAAAKSVDELRVHAEGLWKMARQGASDEELSSESRELQCEIFTHRQSAPLIFDWIYNRLRNNQEELMNVGAESLVGEIAKSDAERTVFGE